MNRPLRPLIPEMRRLLYIASGLVALAAFQLFVLTDHTNRYFSWTIKPGLTAAFLGAGYLASVFLELLSARSRLWVLARIAVPAVLVFTVFTEIATLIHINRFHFGERLVWAGAAAWVWLAIYTLVPVALVILLIAQLRIGGADPPKQVLLPRWIRSALAVQGALLIPLGVALFVAPKRVGSIWPWSVTPLTGRAIAAWLIGVGVGLVHAAVEGDGERVRSGLVAFGLLGALELVALARYGGDMDWGRPAAWVYLLFVISVLAVSVLGLGAAATAGRGRVAREVGT